VRLSTVPPVRTLGPNADITKRPQRGGQAEAANRWSRYGAAQFQYPPALKLFRTSPIWVMTFTSVLWRFAMMAGGIALSRLYATISIISAWWRCAFQWTVFEPASGLIRPVPAMRAWTHTQGVYSESSGQERRGTPSGMEPSRGPRRSPVI
jgi:hypothetical protein